MTSAILGFDAAPSTDRELERQERTTSASLSASDRMAVAIAARDWAATPLGPRDAWPTALSQAVALLLDSPLAQLLMWGSEAIVVYNDAFAPLAGGSHSNALGRPARGALAETWNLHGPMVERCLRGEPVVVRDRPFSKVVEGEPEQVWFDLYYAPIRENGQPAGVLCTAVESTGRLQADERVAETERRLAASEARLSMLVNQASVGIVQSDLDGRLVSANERFCSIVGRTADDLVGRKVEALTSADDRDASRSLLAELLKTGKAFTAEKRMVRPDGSLVWVSNHVSLARDTTGRPEFVIRIVQDISDRKEAEARAQESSERIELALGAGAVLGTWVWNVRDDRITCDARFARSFSISLEEASAGFPITRALASIHPDDVDAVGAAIEACLKEGGPFRAEYRLRQPEGIWQWVEANGHCERDPDGTPIRFPGVLINIGHRRNAAERQAFLISLGDQLRTIDRPEEVVGKAVETTARYLRAALLGYGEASPDARWLDLLATWTEGEPIQSNRFATAAFGDEAAEVLRAGHSFLSALNPLSTEQHGPAPGLDGHALAVPLFREGRWHAVMFAAGSAGRSWTEQEADLLREVIGRTWDAMERARAVVTLRRAQSRQAFLLRLNDHLSEIHDPREVTELVAESLGSYLGVTRAVYGEVSHEDKSFVFDTGWADGSVEPFKGSFGFEGHLDTDVAQLMRGLTVTEDDFAHRAQVPPTLATALERSGTRAALAVPLIRDGQLRAGLFLAQSAPRRWSLEEISLTQEVARRTWDALERTRAEAALQRSEANLRAMFDTLPVGILFAQLPSGRVTEANARVVKILGYDGSQSDLTYNDWVAFDEGGRQVPVEEHPLFIAVTTGEMATRTFHHQRGDGSRVWISVIGAPVRDAEGRITGGLVTVVDIDREKRAEAALRELNATLEQQVEERTRDRDRIWRNSRDLLAVMGLDGTLHAVNPSWTTLLGWSADDLAGRRFDTFVHPADVAPTYAAIDSLRSGTLTLPFENRYRSKDGNYRWVSWTASVEGETAFTNGRDVTAEKEQAHALRQAEEQLRQSQKMEAVGQLTGGIAHDFNNLLTGITGALDLLSRRIEQGRLENTGRYIEMAMNSANRAASLTHRLLAFSRRQPLEAKPVDANRLVRSMDELLRRTLGEKIELEIAVEDDLWLTLCDPHQLENALLNLVINARDAMPDGGTLRIETANAAFDASGAAREAGVRAGSYIMLAVSDSGTGMSEDVIARAFDPFFTTKPIGQGTGLGLSMIYGFAKQSDGSVRITSEVDVGTTVRLYLPRYKGEIAEAEEQRSAPPRAEDGETVLIVEDDPTVRTLALEVLRDLGYRALEAEDGPAGLRVLDSPVHIDLLVTDVGLPGLNGRQLADRARELRPNLKVLFITGYAENATFGGDRLDLGMQMITKPFAVDALATRIREMLATS